MLSLARIFPAVRILLAVLTLACGCTAAAAQTFQTAAPQAVLIDAETGAVLFDVGGNTRVSPASLAKIMTAEVVFHEISRGRLKLEDEFITSEFAWRRGGAPAGGSAMFLTPNMRARVSDLLAGLIVASGNDAAIVLAEGISGSEANFSKLMNERAQLLGLTQSTFRNANGWADPEQRVTMRDMARLAAHIIKTYPEHYPIFGQKELLWNKVKQQNRNPLIGQETGADGLKTGFLEESGYSLVGSAVQNGQRLILAISGLKTARDRQIEAKKILDWGFRSFEVKTLLAAGTVVGEGALFGASQGRVALVTTGDIRLPIPRGAAERMSARINYRGPLQAPIAAGSEVARLHVYRGATLVMEAPLVTRDAVEHGSLSQRALDSASELARSLVRNGFRSLTRKGESPPQ